MVHMQTAQPLAARLHHAIAIISLAATDTSELHQSLSAFTIMLTALRGRRRGRRHPAALYRRFPLTTSHDAGR